MKILTYVLLSFVFASISLSSANANRLENPESSIVAQIKVEKGKLTFIDESIAGSFGFGILEEGAVNLAPFYEQEATPLEIFLAYAPQGTKIPEVLYRAHNHYREQNPTIPEKPRRFKQSSVQVKVPLDNFILSPLQTISGYYKYNLKKDTDNCWGWGNVNQYDDLVGNEPGTYNGHERSAAVEAFRDWSQIPTGALMTTSQGYFFEENAEQQNDQYYSTGYANKRAFAMCVTHARVHPSESPFACDVDDGVSLNNVNYRLKIRAYQGNNTWTSDNIFLQGYGEGARYRSSSSASRKYRLEVVDLSSNSWICKERYDVFWRSKKNAPPPSEIYQVN